MRNSGGPARSGCCARTTTRARRPRSACARRCDAAVLARADRVCARPDESVEIVVDYLPLELGRHERTFLLVCDNCTVEQYAIRGQSEQVMLEMTELNGAKLHGRSVPQQLHYESVALGASRGHSLHVRNTSPLPLEFRWELRPAVCLMRARASPT